MTQPIMDTRSPYLLNKFNNFLKGHREDPLANIEETVGVDITIIEEVDTTEITIEEEDIEDREEVMATVVEIEIMTMMDRMIMTGRITMLKIMMVTFKTARRDPEIVHVGQDLVIEVEVKEEVQDTVNS